MGVNLKKGSSLVTIVVPCYNHGHYLAECLDSILKQSLDCWQAIVIDDASPDERLISEVIDNVGDERIRVIRHDRNKGLAASRNTGIRESTTDLVLCVDADDKIAEDCLAKLVPVISKDESLDCVFSDCQLFGRRNDILEFYGPPVGQKLLRPKDTIPGAGTLMRRRLWENLGGYDESDVLRLGREDFEFWIRAFAQGCNAVRVQKPLYQYRISHNSMSIACRTDADKVAQYIHDKNREIFDSEKQAKAFLSFFYQEAALASYIKRDRARALKLAYQAFGLKPSTSTLVSLGKTMLPGALVQHLQNGEVRRALPFVGYPLRGNQRHRPFFIIGSARSGNTLLRRILTSHSELYIPPETFVLGQCIRKFKSHSRKLNWTDLVYFIFSQFEFHPEFHTFDTWLGPLVERMRGLPLNVRNLAYLLSSFYKYHAEVHGQTFSRWGDKTPMNSLDDNLVKDSAGTATRWLKRDNPSEVGYGTPQTLERLLRVFPDAQFVHILRDGCDVAFSNIQGGFLYDIRDAGYRWLHVVRQTRRFVEKYSENCFEVRYEDLVTNPGDAVEKLCDFLEVDFEEEMLKSERQAANLGDVSEWYWHNEVHEPINSTNHGKGRLYMADSDREALQYIIGDELAALGFPPVTQAASPKKWEVSVTQ